jgi:hypothetical protein
MVERERKMTENVKCLEVKYFEGSAFAYEDCAALCDNIREKHSFAVAGTQEFTDRELRMSSQVTASILKILRQNFRNKANFCHVTIKRLNDGGETVK